MHPSTRLSFFRAATPLFGWASTGKGTPTALGARDDEASGKKRRGLWSSFRGRRERSPELALKEPIRLNFLFVGARSSGQTSLLL